MENVQLLMIVFICGTSLVSCQNRDATTEDEIKIEINKTEPDDDPEDSIPPELRQKLEKMAQVFGAMRLYDKDAEVTAYLKQHDFLSLSAHLKQETAKLVAALKE